MLALVGTCFAVYIFTVPPTVTFQLITACVSAKPCCGEHTAALQALPTVPRWAAQTLDRTGLVVGGAIYTYNKVMHLRTRNILGNLSVMIHPVV